MSSAVEEAAHRLAGEVNFDFLLGGVNVHATQPVGEYGRRLLMRIWREVQETTGTGFGFRLPDPFVFNSTVPCLAIAAVRRHMGVPPFGYLHHLQQRFFAEGADLNDVELLARAAEGFGVSRDVVVRGVEDEGLRAALADEFEGSRRYGTNALPSLLAETDGERRLLAGGYADAAMLEQLIRQALDRC
jgi:protein-disulfide isomerase-like protein with CxxC motif